MRKTFRKCVALFLAEALTIAIVPTTSPAYAEEITETQTPLETEAPVESEIPLIPTISGDLDASGTVEALDALILLKHIVKLEILEDEVLPFAEVTKDSVIDASDALTILKYVVKLVPELPHDVSFFNERARIINVIKEDVIQNGETTADDIKYIGCTITDNSNSDILYQFVPQIDYSAAIDQLIFGNSIFYFDVAKDTYLMETVAIITDGLKAEAGYMLFKFDQEGNIISDKILYTEFYPYQVTEDYEFVFQDEQSIGTFSDERANKGIHLALVGINHLLMKTYYVKIDNIGFKNLKVDDLWITTDGIGTLPPFH